ncbi:MAG: hypothetical protein CSYNP_02234 [Syntrophus sp. SKADARSKE-3]|nr:hypothetical protein [Syntrophus sp. SKADARSKE-3]
MRRILGLLFLITIMFTACAHEKHGNREKDYQKFWCDKHHGQMEYVLNDRTRVDCLTSEYAVEFDFGHKWAEATGQALYYGLKTGKKPGIVLILKESAEERYYKRLKLLADEYKIKLWKMKPSDLD